MHKRKTFKETTYEQKQHKYQQPINNNQMMLKNGAPIWGLSLFEPPKNFELRNTWLFSDNFSFKSSPISQDSFKIGRISLAQLDMPAEPLLEDRLRAGLTSSAWRRGAVTLRGSRGLLQIRRAWVQLVKGDMKNEGNKKKGLTKILKLGIILNLDTQNMYPQIFDPKSFRFWDSPTETGETTMTTFNNLREQKLAIVG